MKINLSFEQLKSLFREGKLDKKEYIHEAYLFHSLLFDYSKILNGTEVNEIRITSNNICFQVGNEGMKLLCPPNEARVAPIESINFDKYEPNETRILNIIANHSKCLVDIGANIGIYSIGLALNSPSLLVYAFEPTPTSFVYLQRNIALNGIGKRVIAFQYALSDRIGSSVLHIAPQHGENASLQNVANAADALMLTCLTTTLDSWVENFNVKPDLIKCDVEGGELLVFRGGLESIKKFRPVVFSELLRKWAKGFGYHPNEVLNLFSSLNYKCFAIGNKKIRAVDIIDEYTPETNYLFIDPSHHALVFKALAPFIHH